MEKRLKQDLKRLTRSKKMPSPAALGSGASVVNCTDGIIGTACAFNPSPYMWNWNTPSVICYA